MADSHPASTRSRRAKTGTNRSSPPLPKNHVELGNGLSNHNPTARCRTDAVWLAPQYAAARAGEDAKWRELSLSTDLPGLGDFSQTAVSEMVRAPHTC